MPARVDNPAESWTQKGGERTFDGGSNGAA